MPLHHPVKSAEAFVEVLHQLLGTQLFAHRGEAFEVREEHRDVRDEPGLGLALLLQFFRYFLRQDVQQQLIAPFTGFADAVALEEEHAREQSHQCEAAHEAITHQLLLLDLLRLHLLVLPEQHDLLLLLLGLVLHTEQGHGLRLIDVEGAVLYDSILLEEVQRCNRVPLQVVRSCQTPQGLFLGLQQVVLTPQFQRPGEEAFRMRPRFGALVASGRQNVGRSTQEHIAQGVGLPCFQFRGGNVSAMHPQCTLIVRDGRYRVPLHG